MIGSNLLYLLIIFIGGNHQVSAWLNPMTFSNNRVNVVYNFDNYLESPNEPRPPKDMMLQVIERKHNEVTMLEEKYKDSDEGVATRVKTISEKSSFCVSRALRRFRLGEERKLSILCDMKKESPTSHNLPKFVSSFSHAGRASERLRRFGADALLVNTDFAGWGGCYGDLESVSKVHNLKKQQNNKKEEEESARKQGNKLAIIMKDVILDPIQIAAGVENGCDGVLLMSCICSAKLGDLLDASTSMGIEAIVEVHTPQECENALELGASIIMVNNWDRLEGQWYPHQADSVRRMIPDNIVTIAAGGIGNSEQAIKYSTMGYDSVCLGRALGRHPKPDMLFNKIRSHVGPPIFAGYNGAF